MNIAQLLDEIESGEWDDEIKAISDAIAARIAELNE